MEMSFLNEFVHTVLIETVRLFAANDLTIFHGEILVNQYSGNDFKADSIVVSSFELIDETHLAYVEASRLNEGTSAKDFGDFYKLVTEGRDAILTLAKITETTSASHLRLRLCALFIATETKSDVSDFDSTLHAESSF